MKEKPLSPKQRDTLAAIQGFMREYGYPPTHKDLAELLGVNETRVHDLLVGLRELGRVAWKAHQARTLRVLP